MPFKREANEMRYTSSRAMTDRPLPPGDWQSISTAPTTGPVVWVEAWNGFDVELAHYAYGDGDGMIPPFGPAWFRHRGTFYEEIFPAPTHWRPIAADGGTGEPGSGDDD